MPAISATNTIDYNKVYSSNNYGDFIFLREVEPHVDANGHKERVAEIKFLATGTISRVHVRDAMRGGVKDPYFPKIHGVACVGNTYTNEDHRFLYTKWKSMIDRCYYDNPNIPKHKFYTNCTVCPQWLCFENFLRDAPFIPGYQDMINNPQVQYSLDKDTLQPNAEFKIYSPQTCIWMPLADNRRQAIIDNKEGCSSQYYGVVLDAGKYKVQPTVRTAYNTPVGMYTNEIAAVNMREWYRQTYYPNVIANENYPKMDLIEALSYKKHKKKPIQMYTLVRKKDK